MRIAGLKGKKKPLKKKILYHTHLYKIFSFFFYKKKPYLLLTKQQLGLGFDTHIVVRRKTILWSKAGSTRPHPTLVGFSFRHITFSFKG